MTEGAALGLTVNGQPRQVPAGTTVSALLAGLQPRPQLCAVEVDGRIVPKSAHATTELRDGQSVEIVTFVGGG